MTHSNASGTIRNIALMILSGTLALACTVDEEDLGNDASELESCDFAHDWEECDQDIDAEMDGVRICFEEEDGLAWGECQPHHFDKGPEDCSENSEWNGSCCMSSVTYCCEDAVECNTPLVLSFDQRPVTFTASKASFDLSRSGISMATDWPGADTPWLALDRNGNGRIDDGGELFGSATQIGSQVFAQNGFAALAQHDDNHDGFIDDKDAVWPQLRVWSDRDGDRLSSAGELEGVAAHKLVAIELGYRIAPRCDARGNCEVERSRFWFRDDSGRILSGSVSDVHLAVQ